MVDAIAPHLPFTIERLHAEPDGRFPNGIPNPLLPENRIATRDFVRRTDADFSVAWDGHIDRCFLFDEHVDFIEAIGSARVRTPDTNAHHQCSSLVEKTKR